MRKLFLVVSLLIAAVMLLTACGPKATATPGTVATATPPAGPTSPYIGSGKLDGNGVPPDFFSDVNVRKGFAYSFDWNTFINDVYRGEAVQSYQLPLPGMIGFEPDMAHYSLDAAKAEEAFRASTLVAADGTSLWDTGFRVQMLYNQGNTTRQTMSEILAAKLYALNNKFVVEVLGLPWPAYLAAQRAGQIPIMTAGWIEDIHDPSNWYQPYTLGSYGGRSNFPQEMKDQFKTLEDAAIVESDLTARADLYHQLNQYYFENAVGVPFVLATSHGFEQRWVQGRVLNPLLGLIFAPMSKAADAKNPTTFTYATIGDMDTMDPALAYDSASIEVIQNIMETLVFFDGEATDKFVGVLAESWEVSEDGLSYTFHLRPNVKFHSGNVMTASDVAYSFVRGLLQGGGISPQWLIAEPFFGVGNQDVTALIDPALADDRENLLKVDPATLVSTCESVKAHFVADDANNTITMNLATTWGPFIATIAQSWGSVVEQAWVADNAGWDGSCDTWQNFYGMQSADDPISLIANGTGPYKLDHWTPGTEIVMTKNADYWGTPANLDRAVIQIIPEWGTRFAELQAGDADIVDVPTANRPQVDALVGEFQVWDEAAGVYGPTQQLCAYDGSKLGVAQFTACAEGETGLGGAIRLRIGRPGFSQDVMLFNFNIK